MVSLHDPSQNGPRPVTSAWIDWFQTFIIQVNTNNIVMWVILPNTADWDCFKTLTLREILKIRNPLLEDHFFVFGSHTFVPISWMCKKQTAVSHSSTESEIISLDTGLRLDGLPALELWDLIVSVLGTVSRVSDGSGKPESDVHKRLCSFKCPIRASRSFIVCIWGQWSCDQYDH